MESLIRPGVIRAHGCRSELESSRPWSADCPYAHGVAREDEPDPNDPFAGLQLDESFVQGATVSELPAAVRIERLRRIDAEHRSLNGDRTEQHRRLYDTELRRRRRKWLAILSAIVVIGAALSWSALRTKAGQAERSLGNLAPGLVVNDGSASSVGGQLGGRPSPSAEEQSRPIGAPELGPGTTGPFAFLAFQPDSKSKPVAYDPCRPIHVVINDRTQPPGGDEALRGALERISAATGLQFVTDGASTENPTDARAAMQSSRYGDRWAPVLVAWTDPAESSDLVGSVTGEAGSLSVTTLKGSVYVTGMVRLDGPQLAEIIAGPNGVADVQAVIEHELGHLVGLDHVDDPQELMYPSTDGQVTDYGPGDRLGLRQLGQGACFPDI